MSELFQQIQKKNLKTTAIVGMTKNVGKTVTFNHIVEELVKSEIRVGLVSAGYDGERFDRLTLKEKPRILAPAGALVATAEACFETADAGLEFLEKSSFTTPLGPVLVGKVKEAGRVELAGPGSISGLRELVKTMYRRGSAQVLVDGAINRIASASPAVSDGTILATGASLGPTMNDIVKKTVFRREIMETPPVEDSLLLKSAQEGLERGNAVLLHREGNGYRVEAVREMIPLLAGAQLIDKYRRETAALVFGGALVDNNLQDMMELYEHPPAVIVRDATRIFISPDLFWRYLKRGGRIMVLKKIRLIAVTLNPTDPMGGDYDPEMFLKIMSEALQPCPVFDLVLQKRYPS
ncbi:MAG: hypothetical protein SVV67_09610 [Bacillota bacterium]|nr:hypothetical protein [Bacillota bacterium]